MCHVWIGRDPGGHYCFTYWAAVGSDACRHRWIDNVIGDMGEGRSDSLESAQRPQDHGPERQCGVKRAFARYKNGGAADSEDIKMNYGIKSLVKHSEKGSEG